MQFFTLGSFAHASSYRKTEIPALYRQKREYGDRIREVEYAVFTPLVFSATGGQGKETTIAYIRLAELLATKRKSEYNITLAWMRCSLSFALLQSAVMAIRGSRDVASNRDRDANIIIIITITTAAACISLLVGYELNL